MRFFLLTLLFSGALQGAAAPPAYVRILAPDALFAQIDVASPILLPGDTQNLQVQLDKRASSLTILQLVVAYPNGKEEQVVNATVGAQTTLSWVIPASAGAGMAHFTLTSSDCGCGEHGVGQLPSSTESRAEGWFWIN
jgi:hypothetical protein